MQTVTSFHSFRATGAFAVLGMGFAERAVTTNDHGDRIGYWQWDEHGPLVVLLHGISSSAALWPSCARVFSHNTRVLTWDTLGHGSSTPLMDVVPRVADYAERLQARFAALDMTSSMIVGHLLGVLMASTYVAAASITMQPKCLMLLNPVQDYGQPGQEDQPRNVQAQHPATLDQPGIDGIAESRHTHLLHPNATDEECAWARWNMKRLNDGGYRQAMAMSNGDDIGAYLDKRPVSIPTQTTCGDVGGIIPPEGCEALTKMFDLPFALVPSAGHTSYIDVPDAVAGWTEHAVLSRSQSA